MTGARTNDLNLAKLNMLAAAICENFGEAVFLCGRRIPLRVRCSGVQGMK